MIKLAMVRHGQTNYNYNGLVQGRINIPLNENGRKQALDLAHFLKSENHHFDAILSSPLSRALETAMVIKDYLEMKKPIEVIQHYVERDFGFLDGQTIDKGRDFVRKSYTQHHSFEVDQALIYRIKEQTYKLLETYDNLELICVAHSHVIKALLVYSDPKTYNFADYLLENGDILYFEVEPNRIKLIEHKKNPKR